MLETRAKKPQSSAKLGSMVNLVPDVSTLIGSPVFAADGETGRVRDFLFDDETWRIGNLVLDVGNWLRRRDVVLPVSCFESPNWQNKALRVLLTRAEVRDSPGLDSIKPVYRQQELAMRKYFGELACWVDAEYGLASMPTWVKYPAPPGGDPHLRSVRHLIGYRVRATDGYFGRIEGFLMEKDSWRLGYLEVSVPQPLHRMVAVPTDWVDRISWAEFRLYLHHERATD